MNEFGKIIQALLGLRVEPQQLGIGQLLIRAFIIFLATLVMIRLAGRRFLARRTAFDVLLCFIIASIMGRAINGSASFVGTLAAGLFIVVLYRGLAYAACKSRTVARWLKGAPDPLVVNGEIHQEALDRHHITRQDLLEDLRLNASVGDIDRVQLAQLERNGEVSVQTKPRTMNVDIRESVQTVRLKMED